ncbi:MAG: hypothetical protein BGO21_27525 [Dyadobacter sp. 50-39]|uniref:hypothetical protein n=1 Tax=Dyadobacter sp. 50-39 TaxID=1895756 RepID=UPI00095ACBCA|nr:hypothetical protein [Dyadobacter sp. 50-39]OJV16629.1 MAG: hypothetical protein BGO21_27525 [Dyadobacter sp. 50-39]
MGHGFEIRINGSQPIRAGFSAESYVVTCILDAVRRDATEEELSVTITGLNSTDNVHAEWSKQELRPGDVVQITVVDGIYDTPRNTFPRIAEKDIIAQKLKYFHILKEELKEYLNE